MVLRRLILRSILNRKQSLSWKKTLQITTGLCCCMTYSAVDVCDPHVPHGNDFTCKHSHLSDMQHCMIAVCDFNIPNQMQDDSTMRPTVVP